MKLRDCLTTVSAGALLATAGFSAQTNTKPDAVHSQALPSKAKTPVMTHVTRGTITALEAQRIVIRLRGKAAKEMSFALDPQTGTPAKLSVGDDVTVRYRTDKNQNIATGVQQVHKNKS